MRSSARLMWPLRDSCVSGAPDRGYSWWSRDPPNVAFSSTVSVVLWPARARRLVARPQARLSKRSWLLRIVVVRSSRTCSVLLSASWLSSAISYSPRSLVPETVWVGAKRLKELGADLRGIFAAPERRSALDLASSVAQKWREKGHEKIACHIEERIEECLSCLSFPESHRRRIRTTNGLERFNQELRRRTRVVRGCYELD
jgi:Transposase, Mutator family